MNNEIAEPRHSHLTRAPWHFWAIAIVSLLWNLAGAFDYYMTQTRNAAWMSKFTPEQLEYFYGFPNWVVASWAVAVWGSVLGSLLLLMRKRLAVSVFVVSLLAVIVTFIHNFVMTDGMAVMGGPGVLIFSAVILLVAVGLVLYSASLRKRGLLN